MVRGGLVPDEITITVKYTDEGCTIATILRIKAKGGEQLNIQSLNPAAEVATWGDQVENWARSKSGYDGASMSCRVNIAL